MAMIFFMVFFSSFLMYSSLGMPYLTGLKTPSRPSSIMSS